MFVAAETPAYSVAEAARYLRLPQTTLSYWLSPRSGPLVIAPEPNPPTLCFKNLVECHVLAVLRRERRLQMKAIRQAVFTLRRKWNTRYPLADKELSSDHLHVFLEENEKLYNLSLGGAGAFREAMLPLLRRVERDPQGVAAKFYPTLSSVMTATAASEPKFISVAPTVCAGRAVVAGTRVMTSVVAGRIMAGEKAERLAEQYGLKKEEIQAALAFEAGSAA